MMGNAVRYPGECAERNGGAHAERESTSATAGSSLDARGTSGGGASCQPLARAAPRRSEGARPAAAEQELIQAEHFLFSWGQEGPKAPLALGSPNSELRWSALATERGDAFTYTYTYVERLRILGTSTCVCESSSACSADMHFQVHRLAPPCVPSIAFAEL